MTEESIDPLVIHEKPISNSTEVGENREMGSSSPNDRHNTDNKLRRALASPLRVGGSSKDKRSTDNQQPKASINPHGSPKRNSVDSANSTQKPVPNYLRASTGSCHDSCKYGKKHEFEEKPWKPIKKRTTKTLRNGPNVVQVVVPGEQKKGKAPDQKPSTEKAPDQKPSTDSSSESPDLQLDMESKSLDMESNSLDVESDLEKFEISSDANSHSREKASSGDKTHLPMKNSSHAKKSPPYPPKVVKKVILLPSLKKEVSAKRGSFFFAVGSTTSRTEKKTDDHSSKNSPVKSKPLKVKPSPCSDNSNSINGKGDRSSKRKVDLQITVPRVPAKKALGPIAISSPKVHLSRTRSIEAKKAGSHKLVSLTKVPNMTPRSIEAKKAGSHKLVSLPKVPNMTPRAATKEKVPEKSLHVVKMNSRLSAKSLIREVGNKDSKRSGSGANEAVSASKKKPSEIGKGQPLRSDYKRTHSKNRLVFSEDKYRTPLKLKFKCGKVIDFHSETKTPRRLVFKKARTTGTEGGKGDSNRKSFKKDEGGHDTTGAELPTKRVILKHREVQRKKDFQVLLNNMIEETASKLVETRKSKVKALVGAFETVISLKRQVNLSKQGKVRIKP